MEARIDGAAGDGARDETPNARCTSGSADKRNAQIRNHRSHCQSEVWIGQSLTALLMTTIPRFARVHAVAQLVIQAIKANVLKSLLKTSAVSVKWINCPSDMGNQSERSGSVCSYVPIE